MVKAEAKAKAKGKAKSEAKQKKHQLNMQLIIKQLLMLSMTAREIMSVVFDVYLTQTDREPAKSMREEGRKYSDTVKQLKDEGKSTKDLGPPFMHVFGAMLRALASSTGSSADQTALQNYSDGMDTNTKLWQQVKACRLMKAYDKKTVKLYIAMPENPIRDTVNRVLIELQATRKDGRAPMGGMERIIQRMVEAKGEAPMDEDSDLY